MPCSGFPCRCPPKSRDGLLVRQNPWTKFDPEGLDAVDAAVKAAEALGKTDLKVGDRAVNEATIADAMPAKPK